jgi:predicted Zn-dependent peptidase
LPLEETYTLTSSVRVNTGSDYETDEEAGISHFLEHLSFKG